MDAKDRLSAWHSDWFKHPNWWFSATAKDDAVISARHGHLLDDPTELVFNAEDASMQIKVAAIMAHDQLPRHVFRGQSAAHIVAHHTRIACEMALRLLGGRGESSNRLESLTCEELCFVLLPLRHTGQKHMVFRAADVAWRRLQTEPRESPGYCALKRFLTATYKRCPRHQDDATIVIPASDLNLTDPAFPPEALPAIDESCTPKHPCILDRDSAVSSAVGTAVKGLKRVLVSLSGGVDSMACIHALERNERVVQGELKFAAVHINYCNRLHSDAEEAFVRHYCATRCIPLYVRRIQEIHRPTCMSHGMRDVYEDYTRAVRYGTYAFAWHHALADADDPGAVTVLLGHNRCDAFENILTNIAYRTHYDNLEGMAVIGVHDSVRVVRPLLGVEKEAIHAYAAIHGLLHVRNSTPSWSQRGKIRTQVVPALDAWDTRLVPGLFALAETMKDLHGCVKDCVDNMAVRNFAMCPETGRMKVTFCNSERMPASKHVWKVFLEMVARIRLSNKSLNNLLEHLARFQNARVVILSKSKTARFSEDPKTGRKTIEFYDLDLCK